MVTCPHHPKYDPASGEPTAPMRYEAGDSVVQIPCPYCWQARAKHQTDLAALLNNAIAEQAKRIAELEKQLAEYRNTNETISKRIAYLEPRERELEKQLAESTKQTFDALKLNKEAEKQLTDCQMHFGNLQTETQCDFCDKLGWACFHCHRSFCEEHGAAEHFGEEGKNPKCLKEAEKQLAEVLQIADENHRMIRDAIRLRKEAEKREAVLREALEWIKGRVEPYTHDLRSGHYTIATDIKEKARAALGE